MRVENKQVSVKNILFSKPISIVYLIIFSIFVYKSFSLLPTWLTMKDKAEAAETDYQEKLKTDQEKTSLEQDKKTDLGKERYQKEFFNKLDPEENMIVLYGDEKEKIETDQARKMFWWQVQKQNFLVWWRNLHIFKY